MKGNTVEQKKHKKVLALLEFYDLFGRWPKSKEKYIGLDIGRFGCNVKYSRTMISSDDYDILEEKGFFKNTREGQKSKKIMLLLEFYDLFGRWPKTEEKYKGIYIGRFAQSIKHFKVIISNKDKSVLEEKDFFSTRDQKKHKKVMLLIEFHDRYGRWPKRSERYKNENIGRFVNSIKFSNIILSDEDYETLKNMNFFYSNYKHKVKKENNVNYSKHEKVLSLLEFYDKNGRFPKASEKYKMLDIGAWAKNIKQNNKNLSEEDYKALEEKNFFITLEQKRHNKVLLLLEFFDVFGRWPKSEEKYKGFKIGSFAQSVKYFKVSISNKDKYTLEEKGFFENSLESQKHRKILLLLEFFDVFGRWPKSTEIYKDISIKNNTKCT